VALYLLGCARGGIAPQVEEESVWQRSCRSSICRASQIVITSRRVSREHTQVQPQAGRVVQVDLGNTNGTFLNEERVLAPIAQRDGKSVSI
jgi:pSer/pThr/pTyr-binding forkhead associated (FHA) protein